MVLSRATRCFLLCGEFILLYAALNLNTYGHKYVYCFQSSVCLYRINAILLCAHLYSHLFPVLPLINTGLDMWLEVSGFKICFPEVFSFCLPGFAWLLCMAF